jgi:hypothetical protein
MHLDELCIAEYEVTEPRGATLRIKSIEESLAYGYFTGHALTFVEYQKRYDIVKNCVQNFDALIASIKKHGYAPPKEGDIICIFKGDSKPIIRDGRRRAAALRHVLGNIEVPVVRFDGNFPSWG